MPDTSPSQIALPFAGRGDRAFPDPRPHGRLSRLARGLSHWRERQLVRRALALADEPTLVLDLHAADGQYRPVLAEKPNRVIVAADSAAGLVALPDGAVDCVVCLRCMDGMGGNGHRLALLHELNRVTRDTAIVSSGGDAGGRDFAAAGFRLLGQHDFLPLYSARRLFVLRKFEL
jgi:hypothetical protein